MPQHGIVTAPPTSYLPAVIKDTAASCSACSLVFQIITTPRAPSLLFFCGFMKVLPKPEYTIPAEASQH